MAKLVLTADNSQFGPCGKLLTIASVLRKSGHDLSFIGYGTAYQLGETFNFDRIYKIDPKKPDFLNKTKGIIKNASMLVTVMDQQSVLVAKSLSKPVAFVDTLFWWWDKIPKLLWNVDLYFIQKTLNYDRNLKRYSGKIKNLITIPPILAEVSHRPKKRKQILVGFGGMEAEGWYKVGVDSFYPDTLTRILRENVDFSDFDKVIFTGNEDILKDLKKKFGNNKFTFGILSHQNFIGEMLSSEMVMITPGLETSLEVFYHKIPVLFLPPSNTTQYAQLNEFREKNVALASIHFKDYLPKLDLLGRDLRVVLREFLEQLDVFENSPDIKVKVGDRINELIRTRSKWGNKQKQNGKSYVESLGGNGVYKVVEAIELSLAGKVGSFLSVDEVQG